MVDSNRMDYMVSSADHIQAIHEKYKDKYKDSANDIINQETFMKLLVAEMANQDPLEPTSNTEFVAQLAQFSSMQYQQDASKYAMMNYASSLVGKTVMVQKVEGKKVVTQTGVVEKVYKNKENNYVVTVNGENFDLSKVVGVTETKKSDTEKPGDTNPTDNNTAVNALGDSISRAAEMIGKYAAVKGEDTIVEGFIESIKVQNGKISVVVNGNPYALENILEVTLAYIVDDPEDPGTGTGEQSAVPDVNVGEEAELQEGELDPETENEDVSDI